MDNTQSLEKNGLDEIKDAVSIALKKDVPRIVISNRGDASYIYKKIDIHLVTIKGKQQYQITSRFFRAT